MTALIPAPYRWLILLALIAACLAFGWVKGANSADARWELADSQRQQRESAAQLTAVQRARSIEHSASAELHTTATTLQETTREDQLDRTRFSGALRLGTARLSIPVLRSTCSDLGAATAAAARPGDDAAARADLPPALAADLVELAGEADDTARQLSACQATVITYLKAINDQAQ